MYPVVYFARHGQTDWNAQKRLQGQTDTDLNDIGRGQADELGRVLSSRLELPTSAYVFISSPMKRACETMERVRLGLGLPSEGYQTDPLLKELSFGDWERHTFEELDAMKPGTSAMREGRKWTFTPPGEGAESYEGLTLRVADWLKKVTGPTICVAHGGIIRCLFHLINGMPGDEAAALEIHQGRLLRLEGDHIEWL